ncbi:lipopolysaccharide ABC transporter permease LptF [Porphyromonas macacae]|uniref:Lipopolysaccharide ABC transporter permease LptF n=1 Tax=Porphyromonas macacae TaxID=28115 RepID=A0A379EBA9_9PORP|nr:LptF/LptG family permease [Porphyromonas macacae]SUB89978.1 lipopolysaccharide ABC transporter permease LptF [Porphyromonas macacae]
MKIKGVKRLYTYILQTFIPLLLMTFFICWFIVLLQFLWRYVDEMVGKGLDIGILAQLMFYAAMSLIPMSLPLGILLASLMTFGNLGEKLELLAMKSSGVPLHKIMTPLFVAVMGLAGGLFIFQNDYLITSQVKLWTIVYSARRAQPELEIPEGTFYNGIEGYNIYVKQKNAKTGLLSDVMIYDHSQGFSNMRVINADSGRLVMDDSKSFLTFTLYGGQSFENLQRQEFDMEGKPIPYVKERFQVKTIVIPFDAKFKMMDESEMGSLYVGKNLWELNAYLDSVSVVRDSVRSINSTALLNMQNSISYTVRMPLPGDTTQEARAYREDVRTAAHRVQFRLDSLRSQTSSQDSLIAITHAISDLDMQLSELTSRKFMQESEDVLHRTNSAEKHRKFTFPVACIVFFFIGAPLGAIIRKGGIGTPVVASVVLFIIYYMIDTFGYKMAKSGDLETWQGMWLSTAVLMPIGIFLTYKASRDSSTLNMDSWVIWLKKLMGYRTPRRVSFKDLIVQPADPAISIAKAGTVKKMAQQLLESPLIKSRMFALWKLGRDNHLLKPFVVELEGTIEYLRDSTNALVVLKLMDFPVMSKILSRWIPENKIWGIVLMLFLPLSVPLTFYLAHRRYLIKKDLETVVTQSDLLLEILEEEERKQ